MMKYTPLTRIDNRPMASAATAAARAGATSAVERPGRLHEHQRCDVAADPEEGRVTEGHHAGVAHEKVEAHGEDAPDQDLLEELDRIVAGHERKGRRRHRRHQAPRSEPAARAII